MQNIYSKNGLALIQICSKLLSLNEGDRLPTVNEWKNEISVATGTIQNALNLLKKSGAIQTISRGSLGSFLTSKNTDLLLEYAQIHMLIGGLPLPYSRRIEGLATAIHTVLKRTIKVYLSYMPGSINRTSTLKAGHFDFVVLSKFAALKLIKNDSSLQIVKEFGENSYLSAHVLVFAKGTEPKMKDGIRIGIDETSLDQTILTSYITEEKRIVYVHLGYNQIMEKLRAGEIDAAVWNIDEINERFPDYPYNIITANNTDDRRAVIITKNSRPEISALISANLDTKTVAEIQANVMSRRISPIY